MTEIFPPFIIGVETNVLTFSGKIYSYNKVNINFYHFILVDSLVFFNSDKYFLLKCYTKFDMI